MSKVSNQEKLFTFSDFIESDSEMKNVVVGGSTVFGVGASSDSNTLTSRLNYKSAYLNQNFGVRGYVSTQEMINLLLNFSYIKDTQKILVVSGVNDISIAVDGGSRTESDANLFFAENVFLKEKWSKRPKAFRPYIQFYLNEIDYSLFRIRNNLSVMKNLAESIGSKIYYGLQPVSGWCEITLTESEHLRINTDHKLIPSLSITNSKEIGRYCRLAIHQICIDLDIQYVDFNSSLEMSMASEINRRDVFSDMCHLTDYGYDLLSDFVLESFYD